MRAERSGNRKGSRHCGPTQCAQGGHVNNKSKINEKVLAFDIHGYIIDLGFIIQLGVPLMNQERTEQLLKVIVDAKSGLRDIQVLTESIKNISALPQDDRLAEALDILHWIQVSVNETLVDLKGV